MMEPLWTLLTSISPIQLGVGLSILAAIVAIVNDWRLALLSVLFQYLFLSLLLGTELPLSLAMVKLAAGAFASLTLYWTARRIEYALSQIEQGRAWFLSNRDVYPMGLPFRFLALIFTSLILFTLPERLMIPAFPRLFMVPALWLVVMGLLTIILTRDPLKTGMGLLTFQNGFELLYTRLEPGLTILGLLGIGTILVGLVASHLAIARHLPLIEEHQAREQQNPRSKAALAEAVAALEQAPAAPDAVEVARREEMPA